MLSLGIKRKWAFKENVATLNNCTESVCACAYDPFHLLRVAENFLPISSSFIVSLVEAAASDKDLEMAVQLRIKKLAPLFLADAACAVRALARPAGPKGRSATTAPAIKITMRATAIVLCAGDLLFNGAGWFCGQYIRLLRLARSVRSVNVPSRLCPYRRL